MDGDMDLEEDERAIELEALSYTFPELVRDSQNPFSATLDLEVVPLTPLPVIFPPLSGGAAPAGGRLPPTPPSSNGTDGDTTDAKQDAPVANTVVEIRYLSNLPPLQLSIVLSDGYPTDKPPTFKLASESAWIPEGKLKELEALGHKMWEDCGRNQVIFDYVDTLRDLAGEGFGLVEKGENGSALVLPQDLELALLDFDLKSKRRQFEAGTFDCGVCLEPKKGSQCHKLQLCGHVFCISCLQDFYNNCIKEGDVSNVRCLDPDCGKDTAQQAAGAAARRRKRRKADATLDPSELLEIPLEQATVQRYVHLKRKNELESNKNTVYCPRKWCQGVARTSKSDKSAKKTGEGSDDEEDRPKDYDPNINEDKLPPPSERLAICEDCSYAFCCVCKIGWHGEFARCFPRRQYELTAEEKATEEYMKKYSTPCPTCDARCQKTMGCNHMICFKCNTHFCYLCSAWLSGDNPYVHFNTQYQPCYQRLWELQEGDGLGLGGAAPPDAAPNAAPAAAAAAAAAPAIVAPPPIQIIFEEDAHPGPPPEAPNPPAGRRAQPIPDNNNNNRGQRRGGGMRRNPPAAPVAPVRAGAENPPALQRFLALAINDEEDEWDSDELDSDEDDRWAIR